MDVIDMKFPPALPDRGPGPKGGSSLPEEKVAGGPPTAGGGPLGAPKAKLVAGC